MLNNDFPEPVELTPTPSTPELNEPSGEKPISWRAALLEILQTLVLALLLYFGIDAIFARVKVLNISMQPTLVEGNVVLVNKLAFKIGKMRTGDVVIFHNPADESEDYIKRLIGKPGDRVVVENGKVRVNDQELQEPYIADEPYYSGAWDVPEDSVFVLGDNRNSSSDSHIWGFVPLKDLVGKALLVYWPVNAIQVFSHPGTISASSP
jgi:signal peptidase I